jgi:hypothetical protein
MWNARYLFALPVLMEGTARACDGQPSGTGAEQEQEQEQGRACLLMMTTANPVTILHYFTNSLIF